MLSKAIKITLQLLTALIISFSLSSAAYAAERLSAQADRTTIAQNETFTLTVKYENGKSKSAPDFSALRASFDVLSNNQSSQYMNNNGRVTNVTQWSIVLAPKQPGKALIPPFTLGQSRSLPITITVNKVQQQAKGTQAVFLETHVAADEVYVQEEFIVSLKLFFKENIVDFDAEKFVVSGASLEELPRAQYRTTVGHTNYEVLEMRFAVTPDASGVLQIPSFLWSLRSSSAPANRFNRASAHTKLHRLKTKAITVTVKPRPSDYPNKPWLPAKMLTLSDKWSEKNPVFVVGEPVTRTITLSARGLTGEQLPPIAQGIVSDDFKFYPDQPKISSDTDDKGKLGARTESMAVIPTRAGTLTLPPIEVTWWDTQNDSLQTTVLPAKTISVKAAVAKPEQSLSAVLPTTELSSQPSHKNHAEPVVIHELSPGYWPWLCAALVLLNITQLIVFTLFLKRRKLTLNTKKTTIPASIDSLKSAINAANNNDAKACHNALHQWLYTQKTLGSHIATTNIQNYFTQAGSSTELLSELNQLDIALFKAQSSHWAGQALAKALKQFNQATPHNAPTDKLAELYPA